MLRACLVLLLCSTVLSAGTMDPTYQEALEANLKLYPPGDYNERPVRRFDNPAAEEARKTSKAEGTIMKSLLEPVEVPEVDVKTLQVEAGWYFEQGRFDLAVKRYKQVLLLEPENLKAKANLFDLTTMRLLWEAESDREYQKKYDALRKQVADDMKAAEQK